MKKGEPLQTGLCAVLVGLSVLKSVLTCMGNRLSLYHKTNYDYPQRTLELLASSFSKPKYLETRKRILRKSINFTEHIMSASCFFQAGQEALHTFRLSNISRSEILFSIAYL